MRVKENGLLMNQQQAADYLQIDRRVLYNWLRDGCAPPFIRFGKRRRFKKDDLDAYLQQGISPNQ